MRRSRLILVVFFVAFPLFAQAQFPEPWPKALVPERFWETLVTGNNTYVAGALPYTGLAAQRKDSAGDQHPPVTVLSCSDSRVPPELVFGRAIDDLFVVRAAGNVADTFGIASIEYAISHRWTILIVVLGHERCGAVTEALKPGQPGTRALRALVRRIRRSFDGIKTGKKPDDVRAAVIANAKASADYIVLRSKVIGDAVRDHKVGVVVAYYPMVSGKVERIPWEIPPPVK
jgi:carbonic anhydrase